MPNRILIRFCVAFFAFAAGFSQFTTNAASLSIQWDRSPDPVTNYTVWYGPRVETDRSKFSRIDVGDTTTASIPDLVEGLFYRIYVVASDASGEESLPSNTLFYPIEPPPVELPPVTFLLTIQTNGSGGVGLSPLRADGRFVAGTEVELIATPAPGFSFLNWAVDGIIRTANPLTVEMTSNRVVVAKFDLIKPNAAPVLGSISDWVVNAGDTLVFSAGGSDADSGQRLAYSLTADAPTGASIDAANGRFTWTPSSEQASKSYTIRIVATDNGSPPLTAEKAVNVYVRQVYALTVQTNGLGAVATSPIKPNSQYVDGSFVQLTASAAEEFRFVNWTVDGLAAGENPLSVAMTNNRVVLANFERVNRSPALQPISDKVVDVGGSLEFTADGSDPDSGQILVYSLMSNAPAGAAIDPLTGRFTWTPSSAHASRNHAIGITVTDNGSAPLIAERVVNVYVRQVYALKVQTNGLGKVAISPVKPNSQYVDGSLVQLTASAEEEFRFVNWTVDGLAAGENPLSVAVTNNRVVVANFERVNRTPALQSISDKVVDVGGSLEFTVDGYDPDSGQILVYSLMASAPAGAAIDPLTGRFSWMPTSAQGSQNYTIGITVTDNGSPALSAERVVNVYVRQVYALTVETNEMGTVEINPANASLKYRDGSSVELRATAVEGFRFLKWTVDELAVETNPLSVAMTNNRVVGAHFERVTYSLTIQTNGVGSVHINPETTNLVFNSGSAVQLTALPQEGNRFLDWVVDGGEVVGNPLTVDMKSNRIVEARFEATNRPPSLEAVADQLADAGLRLVFTVSGSDLDAGQSLQYSLGAGAPEGAAIDADTGEFSWITPLDQLEGTNTVTIVVTDNGEPPLSATQMVDIIVKPAPKLTVQEPFSGVIELYPSSAGGLHPRGAELELTATPDPNSLFLNWIVDGSMSTNNPLPLIMTEDHVVAAYFLAPLSDSFQPQSIPGSFPSQAYSGERFRVKPSEGAVILSVRQGGWILQSSTNLTDWKDIARSKFAGEIKKAARGSGEYFRLIVDPAAAQNSAP